MTAPKLKGPRMGSLGSSANDCCEYVACVCLKVTTS